MRKILLAVALSLCASAAIAESTIDPAQPAANSALTSAPLRQQFTRAYNDIHGIENCFEAVSAPGTPLRGQCWLDTSASATVQTLKRYDGASWVTEGTLDTVSHVLYLGNSSEQTIASATTTDLGTLSSFNATITGTATITSFGTKVPAGQFRYLTFSGAATLTQNATSMILPGGADIVTVANDTALAKSLGSGNWQVLSYTRRKPVEVFAANNTALAALPAAGSDYARREAFATAGDSPPLTYRASGVACTINGGSGDGGSQVPSSDSKCWIAALPATAWNISWWGIATPVWYVTAAGNDRGGANTCLIVGDPCLTITQAVKQAYKFPALAGGGSSTISIGAGTYNETVNVAAPLLPDPSTAVTVSVGQITLKGAGATTIIAGDGVQCGSVIATGRAIIAIQQLKLTATAAACQSALFAEQFGFINVYDGIQFGAANQQHMHAENALIMIWAHPTTPGGSYTISGNAAYHWGAGTGGLIEYAPYNVSITCSGNPAFTAFGLVTNNSLVHLAPDTHFTSCSGVTGSQFTLIGAGRIVSDNYAGSATPIPGNSRGTIRGGGGIFPEAKLVTTLNSVGTLSGLGTGTAAVTQESSKSAFVTLSPTGSPGSSGAFTVTWSASRVYNTGNGIPCNYTPITGSAAWDTGVTISGSTSTSSSPPVTQITWKNNAVSLTAGQTYSVAITCPD